MTRPSRKRRASLGKLFVWQWAQFNGGKVYFNNVCEGGTSGSAANTRQRA